MLLSHNFLEWGNWMGLPPFLAAMQWSKLKTQYILTYRNILVLTFYFHIVTLKYAQVCVHFKMKSRNLAMVQQEHSFLERKWWCFHLQSTKYLPSPAAKGVSELAKSCVLSEVITSGLYETFWFQSSFHLCESIYFCFICHAPCLTETYN